jgi:hypothetical protein
MNKKKFKVGDKIKISGEIAYSQDFSAKRGKFEDVIFTIMPFPISDRYKLEAPGFGLQGNYGNGDIYVSTEYQNQFIEVDFEEIDSKDEKITQNEFSIKLSELKDEAIKLMGKKSNYSKEDMFNATIIFMEVFSNLTYDKHKEKISLEQMEQLFEEAGISIHQTVELFTGIDLKENNFNKINLDIDNF